MTDKASIPYLVYAPRLTGNSAGLRVLFALAQRLQERGHDTKLLLPKQPRKNDPFFTRYPDLKVASVADLLALREANINPITVYPESVFGNPLNSAHVVRYILNIPGKFGPAQFGAQDMLFGYEDNLTQMAGGLGTLKIEVVDQARFTPPADHSARKGVCFYAAKYRKLGGVVSDLPEGAIEILREGPDAQTQDEIAQLFRGCKAFYTYEPTLMTTEAGLCGCPTIFIPNEQFKGSFGEHAYGSDRETINLEDPDIHINTENFFRQLQERIKAKESEQLTHFIALTQERAAQGQQRNPLFVTIKRPSGRLKLKELAAAIFAVMRAKPSAVLGLIRSEWANYRG